MIYVFLILLAIMLFFGIRKLLKKPQLNYDYTDMVQYNKTVQSTNTAPLPMPPTKNELDVLFEIITDNNDDRAVLKTLTEVYEQLMATNNKLDILILTLSELLYDKAINAKDEDEAEKAYRASRITKRLAHNLYRRYRIKNPMHTNPKFLQFLD